MNKVLKSNIEAGSRESNEPRLLGSIVSEMLHGDSPLAIGYRQYIASLENEETEVENDQLFKDFYPNTELGVDLKLITRTPGRMPVGDFINCMLTRDSDYHYTAVENDIKRKVAEQRNPYVYTGKRINVHLKSDGTPYPTFNRPRYTKDFSFQDFCREAAEELLVVAGLIEEESATE